MNGILKFIKFPSEMKYCLRNMKCPADTKLLRNEVKFALMCVSTLHSEATSYRISDISLAAGKFHGK